MLHCLSMFIKQSLKSSNLHSNHDRIDYFSKFSKTLLHVHQVKGFQ